MKSFIILILWMIGFYAFSQDYAFIPKEFEKIEKEEFEKRMISDTLKINAIYLENGKPFNKVVQDSLIANKTLAYYTQIYFLKKSKNEVIIVRKKLTEEAKKAKDLKQKEALLAEKKAFKNLENTVLTHVELKDLENNNYSLKSLEGKIIVLNFWFTKCKPCVAEIPDLNKIKEKYKNQEVVFFAITFDSEKILNEFLNKNQFDFIIIPNGFKTIKQFNIRTYPTTIIIDKARMIHIIDDLLVLNITKKIDKTIGKFLKD
uniref:peroxiredoxin family protein n=1 Tax=Flavobacterium sp. TaxID=239 RepID=UPI0040498995